MIDYKVINDEIHLNFERFLDKKVCNYVFKRKSKNQWPVRFFTCTTDMRDFIANVTEINGNTCNVRGVYRGCMGNINNVRMISKFKKGDRVMVTEHLGVNGKMELIATKHRILKGDFNFVSLGWSDDESCDCLLIDFYTGDSKELECEPKFWINR